MALAHCPQSLLWNRTLWPGRRIQSIPCGSRDFLERSVANAGHGVGVIAGTGAPEFSVTKMMSGIAKACSRP